MSESNKVGAASLADFVRATQDAELDDGDAERITTLLAYDTVVPEVKALLDGSLREIEGLGAEIVEVTVPHHEHIAHLQHIVQTSEAATLHADWLSERADDL